MQPTAHGRTRCQQRGVSDVVVDMIVSFGAEVRARGASKYYLDRKGRTRLARALGTDVVRRHERKLNCYVVISDDGMLITAAPRRRRVRH
jgi:hypothetical protein